jgi:hypothetical protein
MKKRTKLTLRLAVDLILAAFLAVSGVGRFYEPQFGWPDYLFYGPAILEFIVAAVLIVGGARTAFKLRVSDPKR